MTNNGRKVPDYQLALEKSVELIKESELDVLPISINGIISRYSRTIILQSYDHFSKKTKLSKDEIIDYFKSNDGVSIYEKQTERFIIVYNEEQDESRIRFTIAHELGHIILGHHKLVDCEILSRSTLSDKDYNEYEKEANCFARNLLSPAPLAKIIKDSDETELFITENFQDEFNIGYQASHVRLQFLPWDLNNCNDDIYDFISETFPPYKIYCKKCNSELINGANFCIKCGECKFFSKSYTYDKISTLNEDNNLFCTNCGNPDNNINADYCIACGEFLKNYCLNESCQMLNHSSAKFCSICGGETQFKFDLENKSRKEVREKVYYRDGVEYDPLTLQIKICPRCQNEEFSDNAGFCRICGLSTYNLCEGIWVEDEWGNGFYDQRHKNPSNARYCEGCGKETLFFKEDLLPNYDEAFIFENDNKESSDKEFERLDLLFMVNNIMDLVPYEATLDLGNFNITFFSDDANEYGECYLEIHIEGNGSSYSFEIGERTNRYSLDRGLIIKDFISAKELTGIVSEHIFETEEA